MLKKIKGFILPTGVFLLFVFLVFYRIIFTPGLVCMNVDWYYPPFTEQLRLILDNGNYTWNPLIDFGRLVSGPLGLDSNLCSYLNYIESILLICFNPERLVKFLCLSIMFLSAISMYYLARKLKCSVFSSLVGGVVYMLSPFAFDSLCAGHTSIMLVYAGLPLVFALFMSGVEREWNIKRLIFSGILASFCLGHIYGVILITTIILIFCFINLICQRDTKLFLRSISGFFFLGLMIILLCAGWTLPILYDFFHRGFTTALRYRTGSIPYAWSISSHRLEDTIRLIGANVDFFKSAAKRILLWKVVSYLFIPLILFTLFKRRKDASVIFFGCLYFFGAVFASLGSLCQPFIVQVFKSIPIFLIFQDLYKWNALSTLGCSGLLAFFFEDLRKSVSGYEEKM